MIWLQDKEYMKIMERLAGKLVESGFSMRQATMLLSTIYDYTLSLVMEEQAMRPRPGEDRLPYSVEERNAQLDPAEFPLMRRAGAVLFGSFNLRYKDGLFLIVHGAMAQLAKSYALAPVDDLG